MLQSFLFIDGFQHERARSHQLPLEDETGTNTAFSETVPEAKLRDLGLRVAQIGLLPADSDKELALRLLEVDAVLLSVPSEDLAAWHRKVLALRPVPVLLWCDALTFPSHECKLDVELDGMISAGMSAMDLHASLLLSFNHFLMRREWQQERELLLSRLEERKWIDQAKGILSEIKGISEAEAYDFLRKQAMNERKRMVDVATSIVKVYQLLQDQNKGGRR